MIHLRRHATEYSIVLILIVGVILYVLANSCFVTQLNKISTLILAILTSVYVILTLQILKSNRPRPLVFASLPEENRKIYLSIKNIGTRPAYRVEISFEPSLDTISPDDRFKGAAGPMLNQPFIPPGAEFSNFITGVVNVLPVESHKKKFKVIMQYFDADGLTYSDSYYIDLNSYIFVKKFGNRDEKK